MIDTHTKSQGVYTDISRNKKNSRSQSTKSIFCRIFHIKKAVGVLVLVVDLLHHERSVDERRVADKEKNLRLLIVVVIVVALHHMLSDFVAERSHRHIDRRQKFRFG